MNSFSSAKEKSNSRLKDIAKDNNLLNRLRIKHKLLLLYLIAFLIPLLIVTIFISAGLYRTLNRWQTNQAKASLTQTAILFRDMLDNAVNLSNSLYINDTVQKTLSQEYNSMQEVYDQYLKVSFLDDFLRSNKNTASIRYYTENETLLDNAYFNKANSEIKESDWYIKAKNSYGQLYWVIKKDNVSRRKMLSLVRPVKDSKHNNLLGVLSLNLDSSQIIRLLQSQQNETFIFIDNNLEFSSKDTDYHFDDEFFSSRNYSDSTELFYIHHEGTRLAVLVNSIYGINDNQFLLVQLIPRKKLMTTTVIVLLMITLILLAGSLISLVLIQQFSKYFGRRVNYINSEINKVVQNNFEVGPRLEGNDEFSEIYDRLYETTGNIKKLIDEVYQNKIEQEQLLARQNDIRFKMLASQINPHFLFNTLETIRMQAFADGNRTVANTIKLLAKILRHNLAVTDSPVSVMEEIEAVSNYLDIQHIRFSDRVTYDIIYTCDVRGIGMLPLLIQPVVENSFIHGLEPRTKGGFIYISIESPGEKDLFISVRDNGVGISPEKLEEIRNKLSTGTVEKFNSSIGMVNVNQRIKLFYGSEYGLEIESQQEKGTTVVIHIPKIPLAGKGEGKDG